MHIKTIDLGHCSFNRPKSQVHADARATASYSLDPSCSAAGVSLSSLDLDSPYWFSICPKVHIRLSISLDHALCLVVGEKSLIEQKLSQSFEQAQLWSQLGMRAYITNVEWSFTSHTSNITLDLSALSSYTTSNDSKHSHDASSVQPPAGVPVHRFNTISIFIIMSKGLSGGLTCNTTLQLPPENPSHTQMCQWKSNSMSATQVSGCSEIVKVGSVIKKAVRTSQLDCKTIISLVDICFRTVICSNSRIPRGINLIQDSQVMSLANFAPSAFLPEHGKQLSRRAYLIQPIARFLSAYSARLSTSRCSRHPVHKPDNSMGSEYGDIDREASSTREIYAANLWALMSEALASKVSKSGLKPLVFDGNHRNTRADVPDPQHDIFDECNVDDDCQSVCSLESDFGDVSLFEIYSAQALGEAREGEQDHFETSLRASNGDSDILEEGITDTTKSFEQIRSTYNLTQMDTCQPSSEEGARPLWRRDSDHKMLNETTYLLDGCPRAFSEIQYKAVEKEGPSEAIAEAFTTPATNPFSLNMVSDDGDEVHSMEYIDGQFQEMLDMQAMSLDEDRESITDFLFESSHLVIEGDRPLRNSARDFAAENSLSHANTLRVNFGHHSALLTESKGIDGHNQSMVVSDIEETAEQLYHQATDMAISDWELDPDQDMIMTTSRDVMSMMKGTIF